MLNVLKLRDFSAKAFLISMLSCSTLAMSEQCYDACNDCGSGIEVYGEYLHWKVAQEGMEYAAVLPGGVQQIIMDIMDSPDAVQLDEQLEIIDPSFNYRPGFRVGIGYRVPCSNWDFQLAWTRLHQKIGSSVNSDENGIIPLEFPAAIVFGFINRDVNEFAFANRAHCHWHFEYDTIDLEVGKTCCLSNCFIFRPYAGVRAVSIKQKQELEYFGFSVDDVPVTVQDVKKNNFHGIGPSFGLDFSWEFYSGFNLTSDISAALICGKFNVNDKRALALDPNFINFEIKNPKKWHVRPVVDASIGFDWRSCFCEQYHVLIGVYYETQYWWNQWQAPSSVENSILSGGASPHGDLTMHGVTVKASVAF